MGVTSHQASLGLAGESRAGHGGDKLAGESGGHGSDKSPVNPGESSPPSHHISICHTLLLLRITHSDYTSIYTHLIILVYIPSMTCFVPLPRL